MLKNYVKVAFRNLFRNKLYSFLNITGLAIGLACSILLLFYIQDELSFDRFHEKGDRIFRVESDLSTSERTLLAATCANPMGPMLKTDYPEIEEYVRFSSYGQQKIIQYGEKVFYEENFLWVDANLFDVFSFAFLKGDPTEALVRPNTVVITENMAVKYFGDEDPIGMSLRFNNDSLYEVTGVLENIPQTSHMRPDFLASIATLNLKPSGNAIQDLLTEINYYTFLLLREGTDPAAISLVLVYLSIPLFRTLSGKDIKAGFLIAWPIGYLVMNSWLQNFAYRINVGAGTLVLAALMALAVSLVTVSFQSIRAALAEPINSLRYE
jgi:putative ABC transport system permease protein